MAQAAEVATRRIEPPFWPSAFSRFSSRPGHLPPQPPQPPQPPDLGALLIERILEKRLTPAKTAAAATIAITIAVSIIVHCSCIGLRGQYPHYKSTLFGARRDNSPTGPKIHSTPPENRACFDMKPARFNF